MKSPVREVPRVSPAERAAWEAIKRSGSAASEAVREVHSALEFHHIERAWTLIGKVVEARREAAHSVAQLPNDVRDPFVKEIKERLLKDLEHLRFRVECTASALEASGRNGQQGRWRLLASSCTSRAEDWSKWTGSTQSIPE